MIKYNITGYSTALFSTWWFVHELGILFDAGDGVIAHLMQKSRKIKHIFISHPDRDHLMGLFQLLQLNSRAGGFPKIYYPKHSGSFPAMEKFMKAFDRQVQLTEWIGIEAGEEIRIDKSIIVQAIGNNHFPVIDGKVKCFSFHLMEERKKLKTAFQGLTPKELINIKAEKGDDFITEPLRKTILSYSADTQVILDGRWDNSQTLIHEATFLTPPDGNQILERPNKHSVLSDVIKMVAGTQVKKLILGHFSSRYSDKEIDEAIARECERYGLTIAVERVTPGAMLHTSC